MVSTIRSTLNSIYQNEPGRERAITANDRDGGLSFDIYSPAEYLYIDLREDNTKFVVRDHEHDVLTVDSDKNIITDNNSHLDIRGSLTFDGQAGNQNEALISQGPKSTPVWKDLSDLYVLNSGDTISGNLTFTDQSDIRFTAPNSQNYVGFQAPADISSSFIWTLPSTDGTNNQVLKTNGAGQLSWTSSGGGSGSFTLSDGSNTQTVDSGDTMTVAAGADIDTTVSATDTVTIALESTIDSVSTINLAGSGTLNGLDAIDTTTESTLEAALDIAGDISGTSLNSVTIGADKVLESHLKAVDAASDEECLTYESTGGDFEWQTCGGSGANSFETMDAPAGTDPVADSSSDTLALLTSTSDIVITGDSTADSLDFTIAADALDFTELEDALDLDAATSITGTAGKTLSFARTLTDATAENGLALSVTAADTTSGTTAQYGLSLTNAASTEGVDALLYINNADADDSVEDGIRIQSAAGTLLTGIDFDDTDIVTDIELQNGETIDNNTDGTVNVTATTLQLTGTTFTGNGATTYDAGGAAAIVIGSADVTSLTVTTDSTGNAEVVLPAGSIGSTEILDNDILEADLKVVDSPSDEECLTYESTGGDFEWQSCSSGSFTSFDITDGTTTQTINDGNTVTLSDSTHIDFTVSATDTISGSIKNDSLDFAQLEDTLDLDAATEVNFGANNLTFDLDSTGDFVINEAAGANVQIAASAAPTVDQFTISNSGFGTTTNGVDGAALTFVVATDSATDTNSALNISATASGDSGDTIRGINVSTAGVSAGTLYGINIAGITPDAGTEYGLVIGSGWDTGLDLATNSLTTGKGINVASTSTTVSSGELLTLALTSSGSANTAKTGALASIAGSRTDTRVSGTTTDDYDLLNLSRTSIQNGAGGTTTAAGSVLRVENIATQSAGTLTDSVIGIELVQDADSTGDAVFIDANQSATGDALQIDFEGTGLALNIDSAGNADTVDIFAENTGFSNDIINVQSNEEDTGGFNFLKLISDADGTPDTELTINQDGDVTTDGTLFASTWDGTGAVALTIGSADITSLTVTTDSTGTAEVVLPTGAIGSTEILDNDILEADLKVVNSPTDEDCLTYEATGGDFEWQTCNPQGGGDLAEVYYNHTDKTLSPGTVVTIDNNHIGGILESSQPYDKNVLGVIATKPGLILEDDMGVDATGTPQYVGLAGRVPVRVSTENGLITPGDFLTSSSQPGLAMKATRPGAPVIGQALAAWDKEGVGQVMTFIKNSTLPNTSFAFISPDAPTTLTQLGAETTPAPQEGETGAATTPDTLVPPATVSDENNLDIAGTLTVHADATLYADLVVNTVHVAEAFFVQGDTTLFGNLEVQGNTVLGGEVTLNSDQAGLATIPRGGKEVEVTFSKPFLNTPIVTITALGNTSKAWVSHSDAKSFIITLENIAEQEVSFTWTALTRIQPVSTVGKVIDDNHNGIADIDELTPETSPSPSPAHAGAEPSSPSENSAPVATPEFSATPTPTPEITSTPESTSQITPESSPLIP